MKKHIHILTAIAAVCLIAVTSALTDPWGNAAQGTPATRADSLFERAVEIIKKYETLHKPRHWPLVGYGHKVLPGEKFSRKKQLTEAEADALLRKDLLKNCAVFRDYGADSLLLGVLAYNIGSGATKRSSVVKKLDSGNRDIRDNFIAHCRYRGKVHNQIRNRRIEEFNSLFADSTGILNHATDSLFNLNTQFYEFK